MPGKHIGIVKHAAGGTSMDKWNPKGELYGRLLKDFKDGRGAHVRAVEKNGTEKKQPFGLFNLFKKAND